MPTYYAMKLIKENVALRLEVNDVPLILWPHTQRIERAEQLNSWIEPGPNEMRVVLDRPADTSGQAQVELHLDPLQTGERVPSGAPLAVFRWPPAKTDEEQYPFETVLPFVAIDAPPSDFWRQAEPIDWTPQARQEVLDIFLSLHGALGRRDLSAAARLLMYRSVDIHKANYISEQEPGSDLKDYLGLFFDAPRWEIAPVDVDSLNPHLVARRRLVWVTDAEEQDPLRSKPGTRPGMVLPVYFAPVDGKWTVVR